MKKLLILIPIVVAMIFFSCDKEDVKIKRLNRGKGIWQIETIEYFTYDSLGAHVVKDTTIAHAGELVVFTTKTLDGLYGYRLMVADMNDASGNFTATFPGEIYDDGTRVDIRNSSPAVSFLWTIDKNENRKQVWSTYSLKPDGSVSEKITMTLKKGD